MRKVIDGSLTLLLLTTALSLPLMMVSAAGVRAETVIGADGAPGADCPLIDYFCVGGNGGEGESVVATGNPAVAYGGNGGPGGLGAAGGEPSPEFMGFGGDGGSAMAVAEASAASGAVTASALAVGGRDGGYYHGDTRSGDASASATAVSGDVSVSSTAVATGFLNPGIVPLPGANASALSVALPDTAQAASLIGGASKVADALLAPGARVFGIVSVSESGSGDYSYTFGSYSSLSATFSFPYRGDLLLGFIDGFDPYPYEGPSIYIYVNGYPSGLFRR